MRTDRCRPLLLALALTLGLPAPWARAQTALPALGESASADLSVNDERRLGEQIMRFIRPDPDYLDDPVLLAYVQSLWDPLVAASRQQGHIGPDTGPAFAWELFLVRARSVNAFALPGGHVGVHLGLIALTESPDELASVLAHELSHVTQRHIARGMGSAQRQGMVGLAAMILGLLAASQAGSADAARAAIVGGQAVMAQGQLNFSRDMEREADRIGFGILDGAGFSPAGMAAMFDKLAFANRLTDSGAYPYLRSHPLTTERISEARDRVAGSAGAAAAQDVPLYGLMRARARVLMDSSAAALRRLQEAPDGDASAAAGLSELSGLYAQALASARLRDAPAARQAVEAALRRAGQPGVDAPTRQAVHRLAAEVLTAIGALPEAEAALAQADADAGRPGLLLRADLALAQARQAGTDAPPGALRRSAEGLQVWTTEHPSDATAWAALAQTAEAAGLPLRAQRARAEARAAVGDLVAAVDHLRSAQRTARQGTAADPIEAQVIDARLRTLDRELREWREEMRAGR